MSEAESLHPFDALLALAPVTGNEFEAATSPDYSNMVGPFGGATAAQMLQAVMAMGDRAGSPVAITVNFLAPVLDGPFRLHVRKTRQNRSSQHWYVEMVQGEDGEVRTNATVMTAVRRDTWEASETASPAALAKAAGPYEKLEINFAWVKQYEFSYLEGRPVASSAAEPLPSSRSTVWVRHAQPRPLDFPGLLALSDTFLPRVYLRRSDWMPIGTVSLTTYFHCMDSDLLKVDTAALLGVAQGQIFRANYFDQDSQLWSTDGQCLATSHQIVYFKN